MMILLLLSSLALAEDTAHRWKGRFAISGFSFNGAVPGELILGKNQNMQLSLMRPSGLPIMSVTVLEQEICFNFDLDGLQYKGSHKEFLELSDGGLPANQLHLLFQPQHSTKSPEGWTWLSTPKNPVRRLEVTVKEQPFLRAGYKKWKSNEPHRIFIYLEPNTWKMRANLQQKDEILWTPSCDVEQDTNIKPLSDMIESLPPNR